MMEISHNKEFLENISSEDKHNNIDISDTHIGRILKALELQTNENGIALKKREKRDSKDNITDDDEDASDCSLTSLIGEVINNRKSEKVEIIKRENDDDIGNCSLTSVKDKAIMIPYKSGIVGSSGKPEPDFLSDISKDDDDISNCSFTSLDDKAIIQPNTNKTGIAFSSFSDNPEPGYLSDISNDEFMLTDEETKGTKQNRKKKTAKFNILPGELSTNSNTKTITDVLSDEHSANMEKIFYVPSNNEILENVWDEQMKKYLEDILNDP